MRHDLVIIASPLDDLRLARQLMALALERGDVAAGCCYAIAISKLVVPVQRWGVANHELLARPAAHRIIEKLVHSLNEWLEKNKVPQPGLITESVCNSLSTYIERENSYDSN